MKKNGAISEKKTTLFGYFLLSLMSFTIIIIGNVIFEDIENVVGKVEYPSYCVSNIVNSDIETLTVKEEVKYCKFTKLDRDFNLEGEYLEVYPTVDKIIYLNKELDSKKFFLNDLDKKINYLLAKYNISVKEEIHKFRDSNFDYRKIQREFKDIEDKKIKLEEEIEALTKSRDKLVESISKDLETLKENYKKAQEVYEKEYRKFKVKLALLEALFVFPIFLIMVKIYFKLKAKDSHNTVIFSFISGAIGFLILEVLIEFILNILPDDLKELLILWAEDFIVFRYLLYYLILALAISIFVAIVFYIQKMIFSKDAIAFRRLKDSQCPNCAFRVEVGDIYCSNCANEIQVKCSNCGELKLKDMKFCSKCGA